MTATLRALTGLCLLLAPLTPANLNPGPVPAGMYLEEFCYLEDYMPAPCVEPTYP